MSIKIITDSSSDFLQSYADERDIQIAHMKVIIDGEEYIDGVTLSKKEFYEKMRNSKEVPKTSQVPPAQFTEMFEEALKTNDAVIGIFLSSHLSGTYQSAVMAKEAVGSDNVYVIDSQQATFALQMLVNIAADMRDEGLEAKEIVDKINEIKGKIRLYAMIDDLKNLKKGGRLSTAGLVIGTAFHIKPIITVIDGSVHIAEKVKGRKKAIEFMCQRYMDKCKDFTKPIYIANTDCVELFNEFKQKFNELAGECKFVDAEVGTTIATHVGCGCIGFAQIEK